MVSQIPRFLVGTKGPCERLYCYCFLLLLAQRLERFSSGTHVCGCVIHSTHSSQNNKNLRILYKKNYKTFGTSTILYLFKSIVKMNHNHR